MSSESRKMFRIRNKPKKPDLRDYSNKRQEKVIFDAYDVMSVQELQKLLDNLPSTAYLETDLDYSSCWYEGDTPGAQLIARWQGNDEVAYHAAMGKYAKNLADYETWYSQNEETIKEELALRDKEQKQKELKKADMLEREAAALRKKNANRKSGSV